MPKTGSGLQNSMTPKELEILDGFVQMKANGGATERTQKKVRHYVFKIADTLHTIRPDVKLDTAGYDDFAAIPSAIKNKSGEPITANSKQSFTTTLKALVEYMREERDFQIAGKQHTFDKIESGSPTEENKDEIEPAEWQRVLGCDMKTRDRAILTMLYDGCLRPGEPLILRWSDFKVNEEGALQYSLKFKTKKIRTIVMKPDAVAVLEEWRRACGRKYGDDAPVFPDRSGGHFKTIMPVNALFARLRKLTGLKHMTPGSIRNTAITADIMDGHVESYVCFRCWGEASNPMINVYVKKARAAKMQMEQQRKINGVGKQVDIDDKPRKIANLKSCPSCGKPNAIAGMFCTHCGHSMSPNADGVIGKLEARIQEQDRKMDAMLKGFGRLLKDIEKQTGVKASLQVLTEPDEELDVADSRSK